MSKIGEGGNAPAKQHKKTKKRAIGREKKLRRREDKKGNENEDNIYKIDDLSYTISVNFLLMNADFFREDRRRRVENPT